MLKELNINTIAQSEVVSYKEAYARFEHDLTLAQTGARLNELEITSVGYDLESFSVINPPGVAVARGYEVNLLNLTIKVENFFSAPLGYRESFTLCLKSNTVKNYVRGSF